MSTTYWLHKLRELEIKSVIDAIDSLGMSGCRVLEIGGSDGYQAMMLQNAGFKVSSIDIKPVQSDFFKVLSYEGEVIPFNNHEFDIIFSSNVLEHIRDLRLLDSELRRVAKSNAYFLHVVPNGMWRLTTSFTYYISLLLKVFKKLARLPKESFSSVNLVENDIKRPLITKLLPPKHGESGSILTEHITFTKKYWSKIFFGLGYKIIQVREIGLPYSGYSIFGCYLGVDVRKKLGVIFGGSTTCFILGVNNARTQS